MKTVNQKQAPFRHEFYAIALRHGGSNKEVLGHPLQASLFFNSPYQVITWDILPDWQGWYILFDREFISMNPAWANFIIDYPFFRLDRYIAFDLAPEANEEADFYFKRIFEEYHAAHKDKFHFIQAYTQLLLTITRRKFEELDAGASFQDNNRTNDVLLVSRFKTLVETILVKDEFNPRLRNTSYYAEQLNIHPNHLNTVVKRITDKTASQLIFESILASAKSLLRQTDLSIKEIAYRLHFLEPTHFNAFFKKHAGITPQQYRTGQAQGA